MGIHIHTKGRPDMCRCCAIVDRLNELWDRTHNSVLSVNGVYPDGNGNVFIQGIQDISDLREEVRALEERVTNDRTYLEAVAEDVAEIGTLVPGLATLNTEQTFTAAKYLSQIGANATAIVNKDWIWQTAADADNGLVHRSGNESKSGTLTLEATHGSYNISVKTTDADVTVNNNVANCGYYAFKDKNGVDLAWMKVDKYAARARITIGVRNTDGSMKTALQVLGD